MIRCPYCGSHNVIALPLGDYLCLDCDEQFSKGERAPRRYSQNTIQKVSGRVLSLMIRRGPEVLNVGKTVMPAILKGAKVFF
ncbi:MAG: hypothetical protein J6M23_06965 [Bacteroidales bacterium]|nr:hypothetical protein [Bacteroidales bacterium]